MADIRKRQGKKGVTYQVRYPDKSSKSGYSFATFKAMKEARAFSENSSEWECESTSNINTVSDAVDLWLQICEKEGLNGREPVSYYTLKNYEYRAGFIKQYEWEKAPHELTPPDIVGFRSWLLKSDLSRELARKVLASTQSVIKEMTLRGYVPHNVTVGISIRGDSRFNKPVVIPSKADIVALLAAADRLAASDNKLMVKTWRRYRPMLYLAVDSGMRPQEYLAVSKAGLASHGIQVDRAIEGGGREISVTKTPAGRRFIELSQKTLSLVRDYAENYATPNDYDLIFPSSEGGWQCRRNWQRRGFNVACQEAGLVEKKLVGNNVVTRPKYRPYDLRHFYASMLFEKKVNMKKIQVLMGHTNIETTLNVYGHLLDDDLNMKVKGNGILDEIA